MIFSSFFICVKSLETVKVFYEILFMLLGKKDETVDQTTAWWLYISSHGNFLMFICMQMLFIMGPWQNIERQNI